MNIGYARVSTQDQSFDLQIDALLGAGCERRWIFTEIASGAKTARPELEKAISHLRAGDMLVVWKLDRLGRSLPHLIEIIQNLERNGIGFRSLNESFDTTTSGGKLIFNIFGAIAEFERNLIRERTQAGLKAARARGRKGGRPKVISEAKIRRARELHKNSELTIKEICKTLGISPATFYRYLVG
jgi:DNA invertase Pin-like site-specific DNA recombinase